MAVRVGTGLGCRNHRGIPYAFVFLDVAASIGPDEWTVTLSHEALELIADPEGNLLVMGPHPDPAENRDVFHWFEMCDAVQSDSYTIDGIRVSNFVLPLYFTGTRSVDEEGARNDFLGTVTNGETLKSFSINPGGYIGFYDPQTNSNQQFVIRGDVKAEQRVIAKGALSAARRSVRQRDSQARAQVQQLTGRVAAAYNAAAKLAIKRNVLQFTAVPLPRLTSVIEKLIEPRA
jgi:hypothetical protein